MFSASLYIIVCSFRNRLRVRLQRLKQPRYFIGAIAGAAYLYFSFFARLRVSRSGAARRNNRPPRVPASIAALLAAAPRLGSLALMIAAAGAWLLPVDSGLLEFSDAELQFLFPAPVSRRQLLVYRMLRSQMGMLFSAVVIALVSPSAFGISRVRISIASWIVLVTAKLYFTGVTLARARLGARRARVRRIAWLPVGVLTVALAVVARAVLLEWQQTRPEGAREGLLLLDGVARHPDVHVALSPFMALARPLFAQWPQPYLIAVASALAVLGAVGAWVLLSDESFQIAVADVVERRANEPARAKGAPSYKVRSTGWTLAPSGRPETAFAWKAAMQTFRMVDRVILIRVVGIMFGLTA